MTHIFNELDHRMSVVKRWGVVQTIRQQSLAEHSYNVAVLALRISREWFGMSYDAVLLSVLEWSLHHDSWETITGDPPSYMKPYIDEARAIDTFIANGAGENFPDKPHNDFARIVVKIADYIDALIFLRMEVSLGNKSVVGHIKDIEQRFKNYLAENPIQSVKVASVFELYELHIVDGMFNQNGQFMSEMHGFPKE